MVAIEWFSSRSPFPPTTIHIPTDDNVLGAALSYHASLAGTWCYNRVDNYMGLFIITTKQMAMATENWSVAYLM